MPPRSGAPLPTMNTVFLLGTLVIRPLRLGGYGRRPSWGPGRYRIHDRRSAVMVAPRCRRWTEGRGCRVSSKHRVLCAIWPWALRHFGWVVAVCVLVGAAAPLLGRADRAPYQAEALVVARQLTVEAGAARARRGGVRRRRGRGRRGRGPAVSRQRAAGSRQALRGDRPRLHHRWWCRSATPTPAPPSGSPLLAANAFAAELNRCRRRRGIVRRPVTAVIPTGAARDAVRLRSRRARCAGRPDHRSGPGRADRWPSAALRDVRGRRSGRRRALLGTVELPRSAPGATSAPAGSGASPPSPDGSRLHRPAADAHQHSVRRGHAPSHLRHGRHRDVHGSFTVRLQARPEVVEAVRRHAPHAVQGGGPPSPRPRTPANSFSSTGVPV